MSMHMRQHISKIFLVLLLAVPCVSRQLAGQTISKTKIVLLGTGAPAPDPDHSGPATAIVVNDTAYLVDLGPGVVRRASAAYARGIAASGFSSLTRYGIALLPDPTAHSTFRRNFGSEGLRHNFSVPHDECVRSRFVRIIRGFCRP